MKIIVCSISITMGKRIRKQATEASVQNYEAIKMAGLSLLMGLCMMMTNQKIRNHRYNILSFNSSLISITHVVPVVNMKKAAFAQGAAISDTAGEQIRLSPTTLDLKQSRKCVIFLVLVSSSIILRK